MAMERPDEVEELSIVNRNLTDFPTEIFQLKNLKSLDLSKNKLTHLPVEINALTNLSRLVLSSNLLTDTSFCDFKNLHLRAIYLANNQLSTIPKTILDLPNLDYLDLDNNQIQKISREIARLKKMMWLRIGSNLLKKLPKEIGNLSMLKRLDLSNNQLTTLPDSFLQLTNLNRLKLGGNKINALPESFENLSSLKELTIEISEEFGGAFLKNTFKNLVELNIVGSKKASFPKAVLQLERLKYLKIKGFDCRETQFSFSNLPELRRLSFDNIKLNTLPNDIEKLVKLEQLYFYNATLKEFPTGILQLDNLRSLQANPKLKPTKILRFIKKAKANFLPKKLRGSAYKIALNDLSLLPTLSRFDLLTLLNFSFQNLEENILNYLLNHQDFGLKDYPLNSKTHLTILGKTSLNYQKVKLQLENVSKKISIETTHVVLGKLPGEIENLARYDYTYVRESELNLWLQQQANPYLLSSTQEEIDNLSSLILSLQRENIDIALQIMESGGVPKILLTDLVIAFKKLPACKQKRAIRKLLSLNLSEKAVKVVSLKTGILQPKILRAKIMEMTTGTELDGAKVLEHLFRVPK